MVSCIINTIAHVANMILEHLVKILASVKFKVFTQDYLSKMKRDSGKFLTGILVQVVSNLFRSITQYQDGIEYGGCNGPCRKS